MEPDWVSHENRGTNVSYVILSTKQNEDKKVHFAVRLSPVSSGYGTVLYKFYWSDWKDPLEGSGPTFPFDLIAGRYEHKILSTASLEYIFVVHVV